MTADYEAAWNRLQARLAEKPQWGRDQLLCEMAMILGEERIAGGELSRLLRLYGVEVERARSLTAETEEEPERFEAGLVSVADGGLSNHDTPEGGATYGSRNANGREG